MVFDKKCGIGGHIVPAFGGSMVMRVEPLAAAVDAAVDYLGVPRADTRVIYLSPQGQRLDRQGVMAIGQYENLILIAGRYEGVDERFIEACVDEEWSIGDYVLSGGELPAMVMLDALIRRIPGALGDDASAEQDSFEQGWLDCPHYTRPEVVEGRRVPEVLLSGDHKRIENWRLQQSLGRTWERRPDLLKREALNPAHRELLEQFLRQRDTDN